MEDQIYFRIKRNPGGTTFDVYSDRGEKVFTCLSEESIIGGYRISERVPLTKDNLTCLSGPLTLTVIEA
jgi:hypothetical protein